MDPKNEKGAGYWTQVVSRTCQNCSLFSLFIRTISFHHELSIDPQNSDFSMMSDASHNVLTKPRKKIFVKMPWVKL